MDDGKAAGCPQSIDEVDKNPSGESFCCWQIQNRVSDPVNYAKAFRCSVDEDIIGNASC